MPIPASGLVLGRDPGTTPSLQLPEGIAGLSRRHCTLRRDGQRTQVIDHSSHGTFIDGVRVRGYVSTVLGCPYQGDVPMSDVVRVCRALHLMGCYEVSLGDTIGVGTPLKARDMLRAVAGEVPMQALAVHFHDTYGQALANILACLEEGVAVVDASVAGTGGCPYARGARGNVASEDVVYMLHGMGIETDVDLDALARTGRWLSGVLGRRTASRAGQALAGGGN